MSQHTLSPPGPAAVKTRRRTTGLHRLSACASRTLLAVCLALPALAACTPNDTQIVSVTLTTYGTAVSPDHIRPGDVRFLVRNNARHLTHEFFLVRTNLTPDNLPLGDEGKIDEDSPLIRRIVVAEDLAPGDKHDITVKLDPGHYVYFCNIDAHHMAGMRGQFTIEPRFASH